MAGFSDSHHFRKMVAGMCMVAAPLFALVAYVVTPELHRNEGAQLGSIAAEPDRWMTASLLSMAAIAAALIATLGLMHMLRERRPAHAAIGGTLAFIGLVAWLVQMGVGMTLWQMASDGVQPSDLAAYQGMTDAFGSMFVAFALPVLTAIGYLVLAHGMFGARVVDWWMAVLIGIAPVALVVASLVASEALGMLGAALLLVGLGSTGVMVLRETDADWEHTPEFRGMRPAAGTR